MLLLALSDIHASYDAVDRILAREPACDVIVIAGDLTSHGSVSEAETAIKRIQRSGKPVLAVAGNLDLPEIEYVYVSMGVALNGRGVTIGDVGFFGASGCPPTQMQTPYEVPEPEIEKRILDGWKSVQNARRKIFIPHTPPYNTSLDRIFIGKHVGSTAVRKFIDAHQPDAVICGHIHEARGTEVLGKTQMVNCGAAGKGRYALVTIGETVRVENRG